MNRSRRGPLAGKVAVVAGATRGVPEAWRGRLRLQNARLHERGIAVPSSTVIDGRFTLRVCIINHRSRRNDFDLFVREAESVVGEIMVGMGLRQGAAR